MMQTIYCDEAGFSGNNLLDADQPFFAVGTVAIEADEAQEVVAKAVRDYRINGPELKGQRLLRFARGRNAISYILETIAGRGIVAVWHKRYSLASKFFEHVFEPVLADQNSMFYGIGFHRFISNVVYFEALTGDRMAARALEEFQSVVREKGTKKVAAIFAGDGIDAQRSDILRHIETFVMCHQDAIAREVESFVDPDPVYSWTLDLSFSALMALLTEWGERYDVLRVLIDESKPLYAHRGVFDVMVGRTDKAYVTFEDKRRSIIFNLGEPVAFVKSHDHPGIQLADVLASAAIHLVRAPREEQSQKWLQVLGPCISDYCVLPDSERIDLRSEVGFVNALVLYELVDRTLRDRDLFDDMPNFIAAARAAHGRALIRGELD